MQSKNKKIYFFFKKLIIKDPFNDPIIKLVPAMKEIGKGIVLNEKKLIVRFELLFWILKIIKTNKKELKMRLRQVIWKIFFMILV